MCCAIDSHIDPDLAAQAPSLGTGLAVAVGIVFDISSKLLIGLRADSPKVTLAEI
jgi:hypothetical protein